MRIGRKNTGAVCVDALKSQIEAACHAGVDGRVCGDHCKLVCGNCASMKCQCMCTHECENLPRMLSSEPDQFPVEEGIAPLVFELRRTGLFAPCWSCEGHLGGSGELWKLPQVWFYCDSMVHIRLFAEMLKLLEIRRAIGTKWSISLTFSNPDNPDTTFALAPQLAAGKTPSLALLQSDAKVIAVALPATFAEAAKALSTSLS